MQRKIRFLVLLLMMGLVLAACKSEGKETSGTGGDGEVSGEITVWAHPYTAGPETESTMWDEMIASYEDEFDVKVNFETIPWDNRDQKILTALASNNGPDVFYAIPDQMPQYAEEGMLLNLDPYLEDNDMDDFVDTALVATKWKDKTYGLPILQEASTFFYNVDVIKAIGEDPNNLPKTWDEFEEWAEKAKANGFYAMSYPGGGSMNGTLYPWLWQAGGDVITEDNEVLLNSPEGLESFEFINNMYQKEWIPKDSITAMEHNALWLGGDILAVMGSANLIAELQNSDFNFVISPPLINKEQLTYGTTGMFVVPSNSDNPDAAAEFVKTITNAENQRIFNTTTRFIPARESAKDIFDNDEYMSQIASNTQYALPGVIHPKGRSIMPLIGAELQAMMAGKKTPQEAIDAAEKAIEEELGK
ncbi:sugar ABC transporter substrate-binding protein [Oceanobacillus zhaokaii]|uniref:Sugar ABC transporter substrate-binding protein n=1 Tax=Oceanobacillus zhaokaii TaxID=2052660 RepID=A0A345PKN3_9BACI|nr:sugar ABC transporter substrate-binding protein [Oceanobacillus zhaokaii]AXI10563.1 sugar ABC transporter substrate-binding protein [Oceanobacillus zhaokaii]